ncbi:MAG: hypothetical protein PSV40_16065 [Polaromonas sp.]|uniref:hypothetical protein n=1 Tax=Polaromonas sp. TaxID=1869339 RepID=UPI0024876FD6|nr:hypothetical protein [Polaromonas sp.]MDI1270601.1 hypothetical protein [Polaromonas sp.]
MNFDEIDWGKEEWDGQDWDDSRLRDYLAYDCWTPHIGLCSLTGFDYLTSEKGDHSAPARFEFTSALSPSAFMNSDEKDQESADSLLIRMNEDHDRLRGFWENSGKDIKAEDHSPKFFIEWASKKGFSPDWLGWAIERKLYVPKQEADETSLSDFDKTSIVRPPDIAKDSPKGAVSAAETKEQRQDRRLSACETAGLVMPKSDRGRLPDGVGKVADREGVSRQAFSVDVKAALARREAITKPGRLVRQT